MRRRPAGLLRRLPAGSWGLADQALISATSFVTMILVARSLGPAGFGAFALLYSALLCTNGLAGTVVTQPHNILGATLDGEAYRRFTGSAAAVQLVLAAATGAAILCAAVPTAALAPGTAPLLVAVAAAAVAWMTQEFVRRVLYTEGRLRGAFANDLIGYGVQSGAILVLSRLGWLTAASALYAIAATSAAATAVGCVQIRGSVAHTFDRDDWRASWHFGKWLAGAFVASWLASQLYLYLAALVSGAAATGGLKAALLVMGPLNVLLVFVDTTVPIGLARTRAAEGDEAMEARLRRTFAWVGPVVAAYGVAAAALAGPLLRLLYGPAYTGDAAVLALLAVYYVVIAFSRTLGAGVRARELTRLAFTSNLCAGLLTVSAGWLFVAVGGARGAVVGMIAAAALGAAVLLRGSSTSRTPTAPRRRALLPEGIGRPALAAVGGALAVAVLLGFGRLGLAAVAAAVPAAVAGAAAAASRIARAPAATRRIGAVGILLVASTFVWRTRTTQALESDPLDAAAAVRVALVAAAALLAAAFLLTSKLPPRPLPASLRLFGAYVVAACLAAIGSPQPAQALYRAIELGAGLLAVAAALVLLGDRGGVALLRLLVGAIAALVAVVWIEAAAVPGRAWHPVPSFGRYELQGWMPVYSSNTVGTLGGLLALWGLARPGRGRRGALLDDLALAVGAATLLAAQYRTGIIAFLLVAPLVAWRRRRRIFVALAAATALLVLYAGVGVVRAELDYAFAKGRPETVRTLNSRTLYWRAALPAIGARPLLGWGLNVGSRRVLATLGEESSSTIHSTWVEALLGTGVVGASLLLTAFAAALRDAWRARRAPLGTAALGMLGFVLVRSLTGPTAELFDVLFLVFAALAVAAAQLAGAPRRTAVGLVPALAAAGAPRLPPRAPTDLRRFPR